MRDEYDPDELEIINFLKTNVTYIFHIRKIRNEIKVSPSNIKFRLNTNRIESYCTIPIKDDEVGLIQYLDINNKEKALKNKSYTSVLNVAIGWSDLEFELILENIDKLSMIMDEINSNFPKVIKKQSFWITEEEHKIRWLPEIFQIFLKKNREFNYNSWRGN